MHNFKKLLTCLTIIVISTSVTHAKQPTPEERALDFRKGLFSTFAWKMGQLYGSKMQKDQTAFTQHANDLAYLATMIEEGFQIKDSIPEGSAAKPEIWQDYAKFADKAELLRAEAKALTKEGAMEEFDARAFGSKTCGGCHRDFKVKDD